MILMNFKVRENECEKGFILVYFEFFYEKRLFGLCWYLIV